MNANRTIKALAVAALLLGSSASRADDAPATQPAANVSGEARQFVDQIADRYSKLQSLTLTGTISVNLQVGSSTPEQHSATFTSSFSTPNRFRHEVKDDVLVGSTGKKIYTFNGEQNTFTEVEAPKDRVASKDLPGGVANLLVMQDPAILLALSKSPSEELLNDITDATKPSDTQLGDASLPTLKLVQKDESVIQIMADPQTHLLREMTIDLTKQLQKRRADLNRAIVTIDYTQVAADQPIKDELFAWSPPAGAKDGAAMAAAQPQDAPAASNLEGKPAPQFKAEGLDGKPVSLADLKGHVVVLDFWATWCPPCRASLPHLDKLYQAVKDSGVVIYALNVGEDKATVEKFVKETSLGVPILLDPESKVGADYSANAIPETVVIGKDGTIKKVFVGFDPSSSPDELKKAVDSAK